MISPTPWWLKLVFWECERGSLAYDLICGVIVAALLLIPIPLPGSLPGSDARRALEALTVVARVEEVAEGLIYLRLSEPALAGDRHALRRIRTEVQAALPPPPARISFDAELSGKIIGAWVDLRE